ncbi:hypothetical protein BC940DRAFT_352071 [Gongronella butleri]|nr:hypothetical protein BC940DRAFT_352071 [Gongronella butleri]
MDPVPIPQHLVQFPEDGRPVHALLADLTSAVQSGDVTADINIRARTIVENMIVTPNQNCFVADHFDAIAYVNPDDPDDALNLTRTVLARATYLTECFGVCNRCYQMSNPQLTNAENPNHQIPDNPLDVDDPLHARFGPRGLVYCRTVPHSKGILSFINLDNVEEQLCYDCRVFDRLRLYPPGPENAEEAQLAERPRPLGLPSTRYMSINQIKKKLAYSVTAADKDLLWELFMNGPDEPEREHPRWLIGLFPPVSNVGATLENYQTRVCRRFAKNKALAFHGGYAGIRSALARRKMSRAAVIEKTRSHIQMVFDNLVNERNETL